MNDLPTLRAAIAEALYELWHSGSPDDFEGDADAILGTLSDPAVMDELARWLIEQEDGPLVLIARNRDEGDLLRLRQRTERNEGDL